MVSYVTPKKNTAFIFYISLEATAGGSFVAAPTIASGDFKVSIDGGATANLTTLPTNTPASSGMVKISLSSTEMNGDNITVICADAAGAEWLPVTINIQTSARQIDDLAYPATSGRSIVVDAAGLVDANMVKAGPSGSGTAITARDIGASVLLSSGTGTGQVTLTSGRVNADITHISAAAVSTSTAQLGVNVVNAGGTAWGSGAITAGSIAADAIGASELATDAVTEIVNAVWANATRTLTAGTNIVLAKGTGVTGFNDLDAAGVATAVWNAATATYGIAGSYGLVIETNLDATVSSRASQTSLDTLDDYVDTEVAAIKAKTDNLPADPADASDIAASFTTVNTKLDTIDDFLDTEVAAIKAKTDNLPTAPAAVSDIPTANENADALLDRVDGIETGITMRQAIRLKLAALAGKLSGAATTTIAIRDANDTKDRITATVDADGNRTAVTLDAS